MRFAISLTLQIVVLSAVGALAISAAETFLVPRSACQPIGWENVHVFGGVK